MRTLICQTKRNISLFFKDKGTFVASLITPVILLLLYSTFLVKTYKDSLTAALPMGFAVKDEILDGIVGGQLLSSLLAVTCVTVSFCSNMIMVQDKVKAVRKDFAISPIKKSTLAWSYYIATFVNTFIISLVALLVGLAYLKVNGWYLSGTDIALIVLDEVILTLFGTALSSIVNFFLTSQGQIAAVGMVVSSCYGFVCGAYMPIATYAETLQKVLSFLPGTYGTALIKNHCMRGALAALADEGLSEEAIDAIKSGVDCNVSFLENDVSIAVMYAVMIVFVVLLIGIYILMNSAKNKKTKKNK